ncbi:hypothetical protein BCR44DRAFT_1511955 [Catenaria anguillulae PL171]|uniref:SH3 domain-containing protein n=1 Tax=Catenaria anguillulae PL171 TaxID=765915 RepID=A0A1Y2HUM4_9FUNG|nr:hypothetical protein BCR44DRAFT_1511955 [Catenaria anguillulae PL171]
MALTPSCAQLGRLDGADSLAANWVCCDPGATPTAGTSSAAPPPAGLISDSDPDPRSGISTNGCIPPTGLSSPGTAIGIYSSPTGSIPREFLSARNLNKLTVYSSIQGSLDLTQANTLSYLKLYRNTNVQLVNGSFSSSSNLQHLLVPKNGLSGEFPVSILDKGLLSVLNLTDNKFTGAVPSTLAQKLPYLTTLDLSSNQFQGSFPNLSDMKDLRFLDASNNAFTEFPSLLPANLRTLRFANNPNARSALTIPPAVEHVHVSGSAALTLYLHAGKYELKELIAQGGVKVFISPRAVVPIGVGLSCVLDADLACIMEPGGTGSNAGDVGPSVTAKTGRVTDSQLAATSSASTHRTLAETCGVVRRCPGGSGGATTNLVDPPTTGLETSTATSTDIAIRASALSVSMCAVIVILVYGGRQWFKYRKRRRRAHRAANEAGYDMSNMSIASKPGQPPPPPLAPPHLLSHLPPQLHSQTQTSTIISSPHLHTGTTLVYPLPTAPGAPTMYATAIPSPSMQWYPTATPSLGPGGLGSIMSPPPPSATRQLVTVPQPALPPGHVYLQSSPVPPQPPTVPSQAYFPSPPSRPSTPNNPPRLSTSLSSGSPLSPIIGDGAVNADPIHGRRPSTVSSLFGSVRTTKLPPSPPCKPSHLDPTKYAYDFEFGDHQSEKSRRSKLLTSAWVRDHALPASVASPTTASGFVGSVGVGNGSSPNVQSASLAVSSASDAVDQHFTSVSSPAHHHPHLGPIATSSPTSASPSTHDHHGPLHLLAPPDQTPSPSASSFPPAALAGVPEIEAITARFPPNPFAARVVHSHEPDMGDEIALVPGDAVWVESVFVDGWGAGTNLTRNVMGVFPLVCIVPEVGNQVGRDQDLDVVVEEDDKQPDVQAYVPPPATGLGESVGGPAYVADPATPAVAQHVSSLSPSMPRSRPTSLLSHLRARLPNAQPVSPPHSLLSSPTTPTPSSMAHAALQSSETAVSRRPSTAPVPKHAIQASKAAVPRIVTRGLVLEPAQVRRSRSASELTKMAAAATVNGLGLTVSSATWPPPAGLVADQQEDEEDEVATVILPAGDRDVGEDECLARWKVRQRAIGQMAVEEGKEG